MHLSFYSFPLSHSFSLQITIPLSYTPNTSSQILPSFHLSPNQPFSILFLTHSLIIPSLSINHSPDFATSLKTLSTSNTPPKPSSSLSEYPTNFPYLDPLNSPLNALNAHSLSYPSLPNSITFIPILSISTLSKTILNSYPLPPPLSLTFLKLPPITDCSTSSPLLTNSNLLATRVASKEFDFRFGIAFFDFLGLL
jgi:hypothetical protein